MAASVIVTGERVLQNVKTLIAIEALLVIGMVFFRMALRPGERRMVVDSRAITLTLLTPVVGLLSGNAYVYYAYLVMAVAFNARSRAQLCAAYLLMLPMTPLLARETGAGGLYLLPLSAVAAMNLGALIGVAITPARRTFASAADIGVLLLIALFTYIDGRDVSAISILRSVFIFVVAFGGPYLIVSRGISTRRDLDRALMRLALAAVMAATVAMFETGRHWILYQSFYDAQHVTIPLQSATLGMRGGRLRTGGPLIDFSVAGVFFSAALMLMPYLKSRLRPGWSWAVVAVMVGGLFVTQSRGAWVGAALGFAAILIYRGQLGRAVALGLVAVLLRFVLFLSLSDSSRLAETFGKTGASADTVAYRRNLLSQGLQQVSAHPLTGQSPKDLVAHLSDLTQGQHIVDFVNSHLYIAMAAGLPWFAVWVGIWLWPLVKTWRARRLAAVDANPAEIPFGIIVATMAALTATSLVDRNATWPTIALALAAPCVALAGSAGARRSGRRHLRPSEGLGVDGSPHAPVGA